MGYAPPGAGGFDAAVRTLTNEIRRRREQAGLSHTDLAIAIRYSRDYVGRAERPRKGLPSAALVAALDDALDAGGALIDLHNHTLAHRMTSRTPRTPPNRAGTGKQQLTGSGPEDIADRRALLVPIALPQVDHPLLAGEAAPGLLEVDLVGPAPSSVDWSDVEQVRAVTGAVAATENLFGGGSAAVTGPAALRWTNGLLSARARTDVGDALLEAVGNLAEVVGFVAFDIEDHAAARRLFSAAQWCAEQGKSWALRAAVLADVARQHLAAGEFDDALSAIEFAQVREDRLSATARAVLAVVCGQILATLGRHDDARAAVERADAEFAQRDVTADPPWLGYYDQAEHAGSTAKALIPMDLHRGGPGLAAQRLAAAVTGQRSHYPRSRAFSGARLALLQMRVGDPHEAAATGRAALDSAASIRSRRLDADFHRLARACRPHAALPDVADLAAHLNADMARR